MKDNEASQPEEHDKGQQSAFSLDRERRGIRIMKFLLAVFSIILILTMILSMVLNR